MKTEKRGVKSLSYSVLGRRRNAGVWVLCTLILYYYLPDIISWL